MRDGQLVLLLALGLLGKQCKAMRLSSEGGSGEEIIKEICDSLTSLLDITRLIGEPTYSADATLIFHRHCRGSAKRSRPNELGFQKIHTIHHFRLQFCPNCPAKMTAK